MTTIFLALITLVLVTYLYFKARISQNQAVEQHTAADILSPCPTTPNCVCSEYPKDTKHFVPAIDLDNLDADLLANVIVNLGGEIAFQNNVYLSAEFKSGLFGFVDDFEVRIDRENNKIHLRSASRVGRSDLGANRKRVEKFKRALEQE